MIGEIEIEVQIGPCTFNVEFQVMDISPSYNYLLGRSWIHIVGAVPSTLHHLVCIAAEEDMIATTSLGAPYIEADEKAVEYSFRLLEFMNAMYVGKGLKILGPKLLGTIQLGVK